MSDTEITKSDLQKIISTLKSELLKANSIILDLDKKLVTYEKNRYDSLIKYFLIAILLILIFLILINRVLAPFGMFVSFYDYNKLQLDNTTYFYYNDYSNILY